MEYVEYYVLRGFLFLFSYLPKKVVYGLTKGIAILFYWLIRRRRRMTIENLKQAFASKSIEQIEQLSKDVYVELSKTVAEIFLMLSGRFDIDSAIINKEETLTKLADLKEKYPQGWIFVTAHFSNWELLAKFLAKYGYAMLVIGREGDNKLIDKNITLPFREKYGNTSAYKKKAAVTIYKTLKRGNNVGILIDQKVHESEASKVKFFEREAYTSPLVATMKEKLDVAVVTIFLVRNSEGTYSVILNDESTYTGSIDEMTQHYNDSMEKVIRAYPSQWFWMHNRWKKKRK